MAKNKVINTVLNLRDNMSGGLIQAAKNAKKSGAQIDDSMMSATRKVVKFKNDSLKALQSWSKKSVVAAGAAVSGLAAAFVALDGATEEYRVAQGKLNAGFQTARFSADVARKSYRNFYAILGDTDTATEASQLLANMAKNEEEVTKWTRIAAGVHGTFGDSLPIEGLVESANETARTGKVTGVFADALNWVGIMEDDFNAKLEQTTDVSKRNRLIMDTLSTTYDKAADSFYANNQQVINARRNHATLDETLAKVGDTGSKVKNQLWVLAGAAEDGSVRAGSALDWVQTKADAFGAWVEGLDFSALSARFDSAFGRMAQKAGDMLHTAGDAMKWCREHSDLLIGGLKLLAAAWGISKIMAFNSTAAGFIKTIAAMLGPTVAQTAATGAATTAQGALNTVMAANPIGAVILAVEALVAAGILLWKNWDTVKAKAGELWTKVKTVFGGVRDTITGAFDAAKEKVKGFFSWLDDKISSIPLLGDIYSGGKSALSWIGGKISGHAMGTPYFSGGLTRVNERGGEIMRLPSGTQIIPHDVSVKAAGGRSVTVNVTIQGNVIGNREYAEEMGDYVARRVLAACGNA
ncbi:hypothetical protein DW923_08180 [Butyricicoccus sp. AM42-5AC]|nr:hypothetical protein DW923_08180 [Butyricicoccus sp. AM42-5AC]